MLKVSRALRALMESKDLRASKVRTVCRGQEAFRGIGATRDTKGHRVHKVL